MLLPKGWSMAGTSQYFGYVLLALAMAGVGSTVVASKIIGAGMPPFTATAMRFAIASPIFAVLVWLRPEPFPKLSRRDWGLLLLQASAGSVGYTVFLILGVSLTSAANAGVVVGTLPIVMAIMAITVFRERPTQRLMVAIAFAGLGVLLVTMGTGDTPWSLPSARATIGLGLILAAVACEALFLLLNKKLSKPVPPLTLSALMCAFGFALAIGPAAVEMSAGMVQDITSAAVTGVVYYALVPTVLGFVFWYAGAARTSASEAALFTGVLPISAVGLAAIVLGETISTLQLIGVACVILSIIVGIQKSQKEE